MATTTEFQVEIGVDIVVNRHEHNLEPISVTEQPTSTEAQRRVGEGVLFRRMGDISPSYQRMRIWYQVM